MSTWTGESKTLAGNDLLLLEDGFYILLESGFGLILEQSIAGQLTWTGDSKNSTIWTSSYKIGIDDVIGLQNLDTLITESGDTLGLDQSSGTGVTWVTLSKS